MVLHPTSYTYIPISYILHPTFYILYTSSSLLHPTSQANAAAGGSEIAKAKEAVCERGNKLNEVEEKTEQMASEAKVTSHP